MQLIYRGHIFNYTPTQPKPIYQPRAVNWRYQGSSESCSDIESTPAISSQPGAVNWRWQ